MLSFRPLGVFIKTSSKLTSFTRKIMASTGRKKIGFCVTVVFIDKLHRTRQIWQVENEQYLPSDDQALKRGWSYLLQVQAVRLCIVTGWLPGTGDPHHCPTSDCRHSSHSWGHHPHQCSHSPPYTWKVCYSCGSVYLITPERSVSVKLVVLLSSSHLKGVLGLWFCFHHHTWKVC